MTHQLLVLHFGAQCPWQPWVVEQARLAAWRLGGTVTWQMSLDSLIWRSDTGFSSPS